MICSSFRQRAAAVPHRTRQRHLAVFLRATGDAPPPTNAAEVVAWTQQQFRHEVSSSRPDRSINLAKVCLLLALEEEAVGQLEAAPKTAARTHATASTWSLNRLNALAAEVVDTLMALEAAEGPQPGTEDAASSFRSSCTSSDGSSGSSVQPGTGPAMGAAASAAVRQQAQRFPMRVLSAVNTVLFGRHGYSACNRYGASRDSQLPVVMEDGPGSVAALTILYLEVCSRLGLELTFKVLEEGRYCLVWPAQHMTGGGTDQQQQQQQQQMRPLLSAGGQACVIDVYGEGALLTVEEVTELFGVSEADLLAGSSRRQLLAALLAEQQTAHWCAAIGCSPAPAFMTPLCPSTAVRQGVIALKGSHIARAAAAAKKCAVLLPGDPQVQLQLALLSYFNGSYEDAYLELGSYLERVAGGSHQNRHKQQQEQQQQGQQQQLEGQLPQAGSDHSQGQRQRPPAAAAGGGDDGAHSAGADEPQGVTELHAAVQSMLIGGAVQPEVPPPSVAATAAEAALASAAASDGPDAAAQRRAAQELADTVLLFQKLQLELTVASGRGRPGEAPR